MDLQRLAGSILSAIVNDTDPSIDAPIGWLWVGLHWFNPSNGTWSRWNGTAWESTHNPFASPTFTGDTTMGNVNLIGTVSVDGDRGVTGSRVVSGIRITAKEGIITGFEPA